LAALFIFITIGLTIRAIGIATAKSGSTSWVEDMKQGNYSIGAALILVLAEAGDPQKKVAVADMQFNHIEVELGPIPALRLKYKNDSAIKHYIHKE
jgi:hypothetical protein